jgi:hypothetical protein
MKGLTFACLVCFSLSAAADCLYGNCQTCGSCAQCPVNLSTSMYQFQNRGINPYTGDPEYKNLMPSYAFNSVDMSNSPFIKR